MVFRTDEDRLFAVSHILISNEAGETLCLFGVLLGGLERFVKLFRFDLYRSIAHLGQFGYDIAEEDMMVVVGVEETTFLWRLRQGHDSLGGLVDGRELHGSVGHLERIAPQHVENADATHGAVGLEVDLELAVGGARGEVADTHHLGIEFVQCNGIEYDTFGHELRVDILVAQVLAEIEFLFSVDRVLWWHPVDGHAAGAVGRYMNETGTREEAELDTVCSTLDVDIFNLSAFGEVLDDGGIDEDIDMN